MTDTVPDLNPARESLAERRPFRLDAGMIAGVAMISVCCWLALAMLGGHGHGATASPDLVGAHAGHGQMHVSTGFTAVLTSGVGTALGWTLMVTAMMLPPAIPLLRTLRALGGTTDEPVGAVASGTAAFVSMWVGVGLAFWAGDALLSWTTATFDVSSSSGAWLSGAVVMVAGIYQVTPMKRACLTVCRSPRSVALAHWRGRRGPAREAAAIGAMYGATCVGCCWALMLVTFAVGVAAMPVMLVLTAVMTLERLVRPIRLFSVTVALACLILGSALVAGFVPAGLV